MKTIILFFIVFSTFSFFAYAGTTSNIPSSFLESGIPNSHLLSENVIRGIAPKNQAELRELLNLGVKKFMPFKIDTNGDVAKEMAMLSSTGVAAKDWIHLPLTWKDIEDYKAVCEMTIEALNLT